MTPFIIMSARGQSSMFLAPKVRTKTGLFCGGRFRLLLGTFSYVHGILTFSLTSYKVLILCSSKMAYFKPYPDIFILSRCSNYVRFGPLNKCPRVIFCSLDEKTTYNIYHINKIRKFQVYLSLISWAWMTLTYNMVTESLGRNLKVLLTRSKLFYWLSSIWYGVLRDKTRHENSG